MNNESCIIKGDIEVSNGYIHIIDRVLPTTPSSIAGLIAQAPNLTIFSMLLEETAWADSIALYEDKAYRDTVFFQQYEKLYGYRPQTSESYKIPRHRLYGYTVFPETDDVFQKDWNIPAPQIDEETNAITNKDRILESITEKCKQVYRECNGTDPKKEDNALNRFVSYHIIEGKYRYNYLAPNDQVLGHSVEKGVVNGFPAECPYKKSVSFDYFATMGNPGRLMKISFVNSSYKQINRHSFLDPSYAGTNQEIICLREGANILPNNNSYENYAVNGYYYPVNHVLVYDDFVTNGVLNERIRYPFSNILPEAINLLKGEYINTQNWRDLSGTLWFPNEYFKNTRVKKTQKILINGSCHLRHMGIHPQSDEFTFKLLPVPFEGNWQIRIANLQGLINVYIANSPNKMRLLVGPNINRTSGGYRLPLELNNQYSGLMRNLIEEGDTIFKIENQLQAKKHGIMYLPCSLGSYNSLDIFGECYDYDVWCPWRAFVHGGYGRVIIYTGYFHPDKDYYIKLVNLQDGNDKGLTSTDTPFLFLDGSMIEMVPESIYGYHSTNEDWW